MGTIGMVMADEGRELLNIYRYIMVVVATVWLLSFIADVALVRYTPSPYTHMIMLAVVGGLGGREILGKGKDQ